MMRRLLREEASGRRYAVCSETMIRKREFLFIERCVGTVAPSMRCESTAVLAFQEAAEAFVTERFANMSKSEYN